MTMQITIPGKHLATLVKQLDSKDTRLPLRHLAIDIREYDACIVATDGAILAAYAVNIEQVSGERKPGVYLLHYEAATQAAKRAGGKGDVLIYVDDDAVIRLAAGGAELPAASPYGDAVRYPDWRQLAKRLQADLDARTYTEPAHFATGYMEQIGALFKALGPKFCRVRVTHASKGEQDKAEGTALVTSPDVDNLAVLWMPCRIEGSCQAPRVPVWMK